MEKTPSRKLWLPLFLLYCGMMLWLLFDRVPGWTEELSYEDQLLQNLNLHPFHTIRNYLRVVFCRTNDDVLVHCIINLLGNILLFIPAGFLLPRLWQPLQRFLPFLAVCIGAILLVETAQLLTLLGRFDVDDLILNLLGMLLGFLLYHITKT